VNHDHRCASVDGMGDVATAEIVPLFRAATRYDYSGALADGTYQRVFPAHSDRGAGEKSHSQLRPLDQVAASL
jgi:hypothetical protein